MKRDRRLAAAIALFALSAVAAAYQAMVARHWMDASVLGDWSWFAETYNVEAPARGPVAFCFDYCASELPFLAGWVAVASFALGLALVALAWWRPKP